MRPILFALLSAGLLATTTACEKESSAPYLDFIATSNSLTVDKRAAPGDTFEVRAFAEDRERDRGPGLQRFTITTQETYFRDSDAFQAKDLDPLVYLDTVFSASVPIHTFLFNNRFSASTNSGYQDWVYTITDNNGRTSRRRLRISARPADSLNIVHTYSVRLQAPRNTTSRTTLSALRGFVLPPHATANAAYQALADIVYVPTATGPSLASPSSAAVEQIRPLRASRWSVRRTTKLAGTSLSSTAFNNITTPEALTTAVDAVQGNFSDQLPVTKGAVAAFMTADSLRGLIYVSDYGTLAPVDLVVSVKILRR